MTSGKKILQIPREVLVSSHGRIQGFKVLAEHRQLQAGLIEHEPTEEEANMQQSDSDWVLVSRDRRILDSKSVAARIQPIKGREGVNLWTDDYNNLFRILK